MVCAVYLSFAQYGFDILEEGYFLANAQRVLEGDLPYRDFNTPYTPGVFYLYAWLMEQAGNNLVILRITQVVSRGIFALALYAAGRQLVTPFFAAVPPALILAIDTAPGVWSLHPGWFTAPAAILGALCIARYLREGRLLWLLGAGISFGVAFAFKQNLAAYGTMAALWFLVTFERRLMPVRLLSFRHPPAVSIAPRPPTGWLLTALRTLTQIVALVLLPAIPAEIARPYMSPLVAILFIVPLVFLSLLGLVHIVRGLRSPAGQARPGELGREISFYLRPVVLLAGFGAVTLSWFIPFLDLIGHRWDLLGPLIGRIDQTGYFLGMDPPSAEDVRTIGAALLLPVTLPLIAAAGLWGRRGVALATAALAYLITRSALLSLSWSDPWNAIDALSELRGTLARAGADYGEHAYVTYGLILYMPHLAFWVGIVLVFWNIVRRRVDPVRIWYLAAGAALIVNQYPRMDEVHLLWSGGLLFLSGADALQRWYGLALRFVPRLQSSAMGDVTFRFSLLLLPVLAALPIMIARVGGAGPYFRPPAAPSELTRPEGPYGLMRMDVPGDSSRVWLPGKDALIYAEISKLLQELTAEDEPIFTYPAIPGFYYLANRPNATAFNHVFPGMASPTEQREMVRQLERVNFVVWDDAGAHYWVNPGDNAPVTEYIRTHFRIDRFVGQYAILSRRAVANWGEPLYYWLPGQEPWNAWQ